MLQPMSLFCAAVLLLCTVAAAQTKPADSPRTFTASIRFDREPVEQGLTFDRRRFAPVEVTVDGVKQWAWSARQGSADTGWGRTVNLKVTDPRFLNGKQPAIDIELVYRIAADVEVNVEGDTADGKRKLGSRFGRTAAWRTLRVRADDAFFGRRLDGFDLRINGANADLELHSIKLIGHDLDHNPDYARLLKLETVEADTEAGLLAFPVGQPRNLTYRFQNLSRKDLKAGWSLAVTDRAGKQIQRDAGEVQIKASDRTALNSAIRTADLPLGPYSATLTVTVPSADGVQSVIERESYFGLITPTTLGKAKAGEFLYGLDMQLGSPIRNPRLMQWTRVMGADIVRGAGNVDRPGDVEANLAVFDQYGLKGMIMCDPPKQDTPARRTAALPAKLQRIEDVAKATAGRVVYWEMGNEPDLSFFYPGPIEEYAAAYEQMYAAVKKHAPDTVVMNGGLCFAGPDATRRANRFVEVVNPATIDAWAYHGHGPGAAAERDALERMRRTALQYNKADKPYVETESGVAARTRAQEDMQARTCVQKMVYAQSQQMPLFMWFRLLMFEEDYGNLRAEREPRPAVLAFRTMVEMLRGQKFNRSLDTGRPSVQSHVFHESGNGAKRATVLWSDKAETTSVHLNLGESAEVKLHDLFGNALAVERLPGGSVRVEVGESPVYLTWRATDPAFAANVATPPLVASAAQLVPGRSTTIAARVYNPTAQPVTWTLSAKATGATQAKLSPAEQPITLNAGETRDVPVTVQAEAGQAAVAWPKTWTVFTHVDDKVIDLSKLNAQPQTLPGVNGSAVAARSLAIADFRLDFEKAGGKVKERAAAVAFAQVVSDSDRTVRIGASGDWWMAWHVNGKPVFDTLATGNGGGYSIADHTFDLPLRKGVNLLAVKVLSGSHGWKLLVGDPTSIARLTDPARSADGIELWLREAERTIVRERVEVTYIAPIAPLAPLTWPAKLADWEAADTTALLGDAHVTNFFFKQPDSSKWWKGDSDLSASAWVRADAGKLYVVVKAVDDAHRAVARPEAMWSGDSLQVAFARPGQGKFNEYTVALVDGKPAAFKQSADGGAAPGALPLDSKEISVTIDRHEAAGDRPACTVYQLAIDRALTGDNLVLNVLVNDNDTGERKQFIAWKPGLGEGKNPSAWTPCLLP